MWQEIVIILIGIATLVYIGWKIYRSIAKTRKSNDPCCGCSGCSLKNKRPSPSR